MPQSFDPKLGVLSAFEGVSSSMSDIGRMGMIDHMETRRSKMEQDLRRQLQGESQAFEVEQAGVESERRIEAATVESGRKAEAAGKEHGYDVALEQEKAKTVRGKSAKNPPIWQKGGARRTDDEMRKAWESKLGLLNENWQMPEGGVTGLEEYANADGWTLIDQPAPTPMPPLGEATYRERYKQHRPDAPQEEIDAAVQKNRAAGKITGAVSAPAVAPDSEPGIIDAMAAEAGADAGTGEFGGGVPQGIPAEQPAPPVEPVVAVDDVDTRAAAIAGVSAEDASKMVNKKKLQNKLLQYKATEAAPSVKRRSSRQHERTDNRKVQKAVKQIETALKKGNINTISKDRLKIALKNQTFVNSLSEEELQILIDYLER